MTNDFEIKKKIDEIEKEYKLKEAEIQEKISIEFDSVLNDIYSKYEKDYRDMGNVKKEKRNLKGRISELKYILKIFKKEISILTKNKKKLLKQRLKELSKEKEAEIMKLKN
ncbi:MAG: hypothetical protein ACFFEO_09520 [Candidatus Thorarchaeota archaeon]